MEIYKFGANILRDKALPVTEINQLILDLLEEMIETMILAPGIGLAAPQVGYALRMFVMNVDEGVFERIINPEVLEVRGVSTFNEGCLSFPKMYMDVVRSDWIRVRYLDEKGKEIVRERDGLWARCFLHELDHLDGKLFVDHFSKKQFRQIRDNLTVIEQTGLVQNLKPAPKLK